MRGRPRFSAVPRPAFFNPTRSFPAMPFPLPLVLPRPYLGKIGALLSLALLPFGSLRLAAIPAQATFHQQLQAIEEFLRLQGATTATATTDQWKAAFRAVFEIFGQTQT